MQQGIKAVLALLALTSFAGCAVMNPPKPLPAPAAATAPQTTLKQAGLSHPKTVYVPAFYTGGADNLLFIDGQRYRSPNGAGNVMGFIPQADGGYVVAVENVPVPTRVTNDYGYPVAELQGAAKLELFDVTAAGQTVKEVAHLDLRPTDQVFQTKAAFYVQRLSGWLRENPNAGDGRVPLFSYFGLTAGGHRVSGPSNAIFATPAPGGGWYRLEATGVNYDQYSAHEVLTKNGAILSTVTGQGNSFVQPEVYFHTTAAFVNEPPIVDSERTGFMFAVIVGLNTIDPGNTPIQFAAYYLKNPNSALSGPYGNYTQATTALSLGQTIYFSRRYALFGSPVAPYEVRQMGANHFGSQLSVGVLQLKSGVKTPVFSLFGSTMNTVRRFIGTNDTSISTSNARVDAFTVVTPTGAVLIDANHNQIGAAYDTALKAQIPAAYAQEFASQYGMMP
ncbi:hypothetical protein [Thiomonas sp.]